MRIEGEPRPKKQRPPAAPNIGTTIFWGITKWIAFGIACLCALIAVNATGIVDGPIGAGLACFFAIVARLAQAEQHWNESG